MSLMNSLITNTTPAPPKMIVYGQPGVGKTTFAASANAILLDCENGAGAVPGVSRTPYLQSWPQMRKWLVELADVADRVASPVMNILPTRGDYPGVDGITLDGWGNPQTYTILRQHAGDMTAWKTQYDLVPADAVVHWFRTDRPGQHRGIPEITPALPLFAQLRR